MEVYLVYLYNYNLDTRIRYWHFAIEVYLQILRQFLAPVPLLHYCISCLFILGPSVLWPWDSNCAMFNSVPSVGVNC